MLIKQHMKLMSLKYSNAKIVINIDIRYIWIIIMAGADGLINFLIHIQKCVNLELNGRYNDSKTKMSIKKEIQMYKKL